MTTNKSKPANSKHDELNELRENMEDIIGNLHQEEAEFLARVGAKAFTERERARQYFVTHFSISLLNVYVLYQKFAASESLWNKFLAYFKSSAGQALAAEVAPEVAGDVAQMAGANAQDQATAEKATTLIVKILFYFFTKYQNEKKEDRVKKAQKFLQYADNSEKMKLLAKQVALYLFTRIELFILGLSRPTGVDTLINFMMDSIIDDISNGHPTKDDEGNILLLAEHAIAKPTSSLFKTLGASFLPNKTIKTDRKDDNWTIVGGLYGAPVLVKSTNRIFGYSRTLRYDGKYPPHSVTTETEATSIGLKCIDEFYWQDYNRKPGQEKLRMLQDFTALLIQVLTHLDRDADTTWMQQQYQIVADRHWGIFTNTNNREKQKTIFEHLLQLCEGVANKTQEHPWIKVLNSHLKEMFKCLYEATEEKDAIKWKRYAERLVAADVDVNEYLPPKLHAAPSTANPTEHAPLPKKPMVKNPILKPSTSYHPPAPDNIPLTAVKSPAAATDKIIDHKVIVKVWNKGSHCQQIAIIIEGDTHPVKVHFSKTRKNGKSKDTENAEGLLQSLGIVEVPMDNFIIKDRVPTESYEFSKLNAGKIIKVLAALNSSDPQVQGKLKGLYEAYRKKPFYNKAVSNHLHMAIFLLIQGGFGKLCEQIEDPNTLNNILAYLGGTTAGAGVGGAAVGIPLGGAVAASTTTTITTLVAGGAAHLPAAAGLAFLTGPVGLGLAITAGVLLGAGAGALMVYGILANIVQNASIDNMDPSQLLALAFAAHQLPKAPTVAPSPSPSTSSLSL